MTHVNDSSRIQVEKAWQGSWLRRGEQGAQKVRIASKLCGVHLLAAPSIVTLDATPEISETKAATWGKIGRQENWKRPDHEPVIGLQQSRGCGDAIANAPGRLCIVAKPGCRPKKNASKIAIDARPEPQDRPARTGPIVVGLAPKKSFKIRSGNGVGGRLQNWCGRAGEETREAEEGSSSRAMGGRR